MRLHARPITRIYRSTPLTSPHHTAPHHTAAEDYDEEDEPQQQPGGFQEQRGPPQHPQYEEDEDEYYEDTPEEPLPQTLSLEISPDECSAYVYYPTGLYEHQHGPSRWSR